MPTSRESFERQCKRRFGTHNPQRMRLEHWEWMVRTGKTAWDARHEIGIESHEHQDPDWCFHRFGVSRTMMDDGRIVCVGGEHEDFYDPDFCIYNDVIVLKPGGGPPAVTEDLGDVEIYGYPEDIFPPTDFHSASLVGNQIVLIGRLGYRGKRHVGTTPVLRLDPNSYRIETLKTSGTPPGWIYEHHASYDDESGAITVRGGFVYPADAKQETPYLAAHRLHVADMRWEMVSEREDRRKFVISTEDTNQRLGVAFEREDFRPAKVPHLLLLQDEHDESKHSLSVEGVRITFRDFYNEIRVLVEGTLPAEVIDVVLLEVAQNLGRRTQVQWQSKEVEDFKGPGI